ncbi:MAG TPA: S41 family peptidase [Gemmatimonadales bacterium]|nr:S41 family peptidase [Gemmatimonadales bacterium]
MKLRTIARQALPIALLGGAGLGFGSVAGDDARRYFAQVMDYVQAYAADDHTTDSLYVRAARGLLQQIDDPYAALFSPADVSRFTRNTIGNAYGGLGMVVEGVGDGVIVSQVFPASPAESIGLAPGDRIEEIDGERSDAWEVDAVTSRLTGRPGSVVRLAVSRPGVTGLIRADARRATIHVPAVPFVVMLDAAVGYLPLRRFNEGAAGDVERSLAQLTARGAKGAILDLRGNGGGGLDAAIRVSELFLERGQPVATVRQRGEPRTTYLARRDRRPPAIPIAVLVDGFSASASEIVAGALQDHDRAVVVGTTTFGKGLVQTLFPVDGGWALKLTTGRWYTPSGRSIQRDRRADSLETDTVRRSRPAFRSDGGRIIYGGGGITPDLIVQPDTLTTIEQALVQRLAPKSREFLTTLAAIAREVRPAVRPGFAFRPEWSDTLYHRLRRNGVAVSRAEYDAGARWVNARLEQRIAGLAFGDSAAFRRAVPRDRQLAAAAALIRASSSRAELFAQLARRPSEDTR